MKNEWQYWNSTGTNKKFTIPFSKNEFIKLVPKEADILDFGCGYGRTLGQIQDEEYKNLTGCDFSFPMLKRLKDYSNDIHLVQNNSVKIPFKDNSFDAIIVIAVITCIVKDNDQLDLISEIERVLKPDGLLFLSDFLVNTDRRNIDRYQLYAERYGTYGVFETEPDVPLRHHEIKWIDDLLRGFSKIAFNQTVFNTMNGNQSNGFDYIGKKN